MTGIARRLLLSLAAAAVVATPVLAAEKMVELGKVFPYLDAFLKIPPAERSRVKVGYALLRDGKPAAGVQAWIVSPGGQRAPIGISADGRFLRLPTLGELTNGSKIAFNMDEGVKMGIRMDLGPAAHPAQEMDARELTTSVNEANTVIKKAAGPMGLVAPKMAQIVFIGAPSGVAVMADGRTAPLATVRGQASFVPATTPGAVKVRLVKAPARLAFSPK